VNFWVAIPTENAGDYQFRKKHSKIDRVIFGVATTELDQ
jgi:hypothetical protein